jgi:hypothetical protein
MDKILTLNKKINKNIKKLSFFSFLLLVSFVCGNLFGMYLKELENFYFCIFINLLLIECISFLKYSKKIKFYLTEKNFLIKSLNVLKRGFLIGIFVEAFKVGS